MAGRATVAGDEAEHLGQIEQRGVGGREVSREEDERGIGIGDARHGHPPQLRDDALRHVAEVGGALGHVAPESDQLILEGTEGLEDGTLAGGAGIDPVRDVVGEHRILRHLDRGFDDRARGALGSAGSILEVSGDRGHRDLHRELLGSRVALVHLRGRLGKRLRHDEHRADGDAATHSDSAQLHRVPSASGTGVKGSGQPTGAD